MKEEVTKFDKGDDEDDMPVGLAMSIAMNEKARDQFSALSKPAREMVEDKARLVDSKEEMEQLVEDLADGDFLS